MPWSRISASRQRGPKLRTSEPPRVYLAGPDVFLPHAQEHAVRRSELCRLHGLLAVSPLNEDVESLATLPPHKAWQTIFAKDLAMMEGCDAVIANLTPFRGASADAGTLIEVGWFLGRRKPVFGYSNAARDFSERSRRQVAALPDPLPGLSVEGFGLPDNLMIPGAVLAGGGHPVVLPPDGLDRAFDALEVFERCVAVAAWKLGLRAAPPFAAG